MFVFFPTQVEEGHQKQSSGGGSVSMACSTTHFVSRSSFWHQSRSGQWQQSPIAAQHQWGILAYRAYCGVCCTYKAMPFISRVHCCTCRQESNLTSKNMDSILRLCPVSKICCSTVNLNSTQILKLIILPKYWYFLTLSGSLMLIRRK